MRLTQGTFSFLPDLSAAQIRAQVEYCLEHGWAVSVEYTADPHPRNSYWELFGLPLFDLRDAAGVMDVIDSCRSTFPDAYVKVNAFDATHGWESLRMSFIVNRPVEEPGFRLERSEGKGRNLHYATVSYSVARGGERT